MFDLLENPALFEQIKDGLVCINNIPQKANELFCNDAVLLASILEIHHRKSATLYNQALLSREYHCNPLVAAIYLYFTTREEHLLALEMDKKTKFPDLIALFVRNAKMQERLDFDPELVVLKNTRLIRESLHTGLLLLGLVDSYLISPEDIFQLATFLSTLKNSYLAEKYFIVAFVSSLQTLSNLDLDLYKKLQSLFSLPWITETYRGICWLAWLCLLERLSTSGTHSLISQEISSYQRSWQNEIGCTLNIYQFIAFLATSQSINDQDLENDFFVYAHASMASLLKDYIVSFRKNWILRDMLASNQDQAAAEDEQDGVEYAETPWEALNKLIIAVYKDRPDSALDWWKGELLNFVKMASNVWTPRFLVSFLQLLTALSCGAESALKAHEILNNDQQSILGPVLWSTFFRTLNAYVDNNTKNALELDTNSPETKLVHAFLNLTAQIVKYSFTARRILCESQQTRALHSLFHLLVSRLHVETKACLLNTLSAFCTPCAEGSQIVNQVWLFLEQAQVIDTCSIDSNTGLAYDMQEIETAQHFYPETRGFLGLVKNLLRNYEYDRYIYANLGAPNRPAGVTPFTNYVIHRVFLPLETKPFADPTEKLQINLACLDIIHTCLETFNMTEFMILIAQEQSSQDQVTEIQNFAKLPGFFVYCSILSGSVLYEKLFDMLIQENIDHSCILKTLEILELILLNQKSFLQVICPYITDHVRLPISMTCLEQLMAYKGDVVIRLAQLIYYDKNDNVSLKACKILATISKSAIFVGEGSNRLLALFQSSPLKAEVIQGFCDRLGSDCYEHPSNPEEHETKHLVRLEIIDMISNNLSLPSPNFAHFILGVGVSPKRHFDVLEVIIRLLEQNYFKTHALYAEKCYHAIYLLCSNPKTCNDVLFFLRNDFDFFTRQLDTFYPMSEKELEVNAYNIARTYQVVWLLKIIAIELHVTNLSNQRSHSQRLFLNLFQTSYDKLEQPLSKAVELLLSINFSESSLPQNSLEAFQLSWPDFLTQNHNQTLIYNVDRLELTLLSKMHELDVKDQFALPGSRQAALENISTIVNHTRNVNQNHELTSARFQAADAWCACIRTSIKIFNLLENRDSVLYQLLTTLLQKASNHSTSLSIQGCVSQAVLALLSQKFEIDASNTQQILYYIIDAILVPGSSVSHRGNYYTCLIAFKEKTKEPLRWNDKLLKVICSDCCDAEPVWQTVAFATLSCMDNTISFLKKSNLIGLFIKSIIVDDKQLSLGNNGKSS
jgi:hypothetical protein